jgi:hypothetical protein
MMARTETGNNSQVAAIETMETIITFCRLSNMLCNVVEGSTTCDNVLGAMVLSGVAIPEEGCRILHCVGSLARIWDASQNI